MLHAALIGTQSTGKSTLFQLMTSARESARGRSDAEVGISKVPDERLDRLTAIFNPRKRVPATIELTDPALSVRSGAAALADVSGYKNADALVHVVRAFRDEAIPHPAGTIDPARDAQAMEDELILADLGLVERRIERLAEEGRLPACVIMEAAMMNLGVILPEPGYLEAVREITRKHGIVWIVDEVNRGATLPGLYPMNAETRARYDAARKK